jgi:trigger factor
MKVQVETVSPIEKRLSIEVEPAFIEKELTQAYATLARQVKMPGFRPGKVPRRILEQHYRNEVEADVLKRVQVLAFVDAVREQNVPAVGDPHFTGGKIEAQKVYAYTARVEVKPEFEAKDYKGLTLKKFDTSVADEKVTEQLERIRQSRMTLTEVTDRTQVQKNDMVIVDFDATIDGTAFPGNTGRDVTIEVIDGQLVDGNLPQLEGATLNEKKEFDYPFPADYRVEEVKGKTAHFVVTVKTIKTKVVPPLDDAFAATMGFATVDEFSTRIRRDLQRAKARETENDEREDLFKKLAEKNAIDVPNSLVQRGIDVMLDNALGSMQRSGMDLRSLNLDWAKLREDLRPKSEAEMRGQLILEAVAKAEKLEVTDDDVEQKLVSMAEEAGAPLAMVKKQFVEAEAKSNLRARLMEDKAIALIKQHAQFE